MKKSSRNVSGVFRPTSPSQSTLLRAAVLVLVLLCALTAFGAFRSAQTAPPSADHEPSSEKNATVEPSTSSDSDDVPMKWLPDLKVLVSAPATTIDLSDAVAQLCNEGRLGKPGEVAPDDVELSIVSDDNDYARLSIDGRKLIVDWKPDVVGKSTIIVKAALKDNDDAHVYISFRAESWRPDYLKILMIVLGGGGLFLLGMKRMSEGLQAVAGRRLRRLIALFTNNRFMALGVGVVVTTLVQSSTATSVMALGFVNGGLMTLSQAIGVLMGANIGTTTTGWLFTLNIGALGLPLLGIAAIFYLFCKKEKVRNFSLFLLGLGMIFFGLDTLKEGLAPLPDTPMFATLVNAFRATSFFGAIMCVFIGCLTTVIAHSSAATLAITMTLASLGALDLNSSAAIVLGSNIGTSLTPVIVAIGAPSATRRAAYFHVLFNTLGVIWVMAIFFPILIPSINALGAVFHLDIPGKIALTHTLFNVANTIVFLPFVGPITRMLERCVVDKKTQVSLAITGLNRFLKDEPAFAVEASEKVVAQMSDDCVQIVDLLGTAADSKFEESDAVEEIFKLETRLDSMKEETVNFITNLIGRAHTDDVAAAGTRQIHVAEELEEISDYLVNILKSNLTLSEKNLPAPTLLVNLFREHLGYVDETLKWLRTPSLFREDAQVVKEMQTRRDRYVQRAKESRSECVDSMKNGELDPIVIIQIDSQINSWRRIYEHLLNIAESISPQPTVKPKKTALK